MSNIIGIDLGTTNSCVAVVRGGDASVIINEEGSRTTPSVVGYESSGDRLVGASARRQAIVNPESTIYSVKRFMGMGYKESKDEIKKVPYKVVSGKSGMCKVKIGKKYYAPPEISAQILLKIKRDAEKYLGSPVTEAVITVPAYFNDAQRQATKDAGKIAGLEVKRIINEPTAAALAYGVDKKGEQKVVVYDFGGGTFDVSVLEISDGVIEVLSTNGDTHLGGDDVDHVLIEWMLSEFQKDTGMDVSEDTMVIQRVKEAAEKAKIELSSAQKTDISLPFLTADTSGPKHLTLSLTRSSFEKMIKSIVDKTMNPVKNALSDAALDKGDIDEIIFVGGSTRIPIVKASVESFFGKSANSSVNPDEVVALGAAVQGGVFSGDVTDMLLLDVTPLSLGIETLGGVMTKLIDRNTTIPCQKSETFSTAQDGQPAVDVHVLQGERQFASDNRTLGMFKLDGLPPAPRGVPQIEVTFDIDANGIVNVSAKDKATGAEQKITIQDGSSLSEDEINNMIADATEHEQSDSLKRDIIETRNNLDSLIYNTDNMLKEHEENLGEEITSDINDKLESAKVALDSDDIDLLKSTLSDLQSAMMSAGSSIYESQKEEGEADNNNETEENIVDADFEEASI